MVKKYVVGVSEVHIQYYNVEAETEEEAKELVEQFIDDCDDAVEEKVSFGSFEYSHTIEDGNGRVKMTVEE